MSATSSPGGSPAKPASKSQLPASIANASLEDLQKLFVDSLKRLKVKDKKIAELSASQEALHLQVSQQASISSSQEGLQQQLHNASEEAKAAQRRADDAQEQFEGMYKSCAAQQQQLEDAAAEKTIHAEQMASLKEVLRTMAQEKDSAEKVIFGTIFKHSASLLLIRQEHYCKKLVPAASSMYNRYCMVIIRLLAFDVASRQYPAC